MIKLDIRKAYDTIEWPFLESMLYELGFPTKFVGYVMSYVTSVNYAIMINGRPSTSFPAAMGVRQGDPIMSPFLFAACLKHLSRNLSTLKDSKEFKFHPKCKKTHITHLAFADDLLLFAYVDKQSIKAIWEIFLVCSRASTLQANLEKSEIKFVGVSVQEKEIHRNEIGMRKGALQFRYIGVSSSFKKLTYPHYKPLIKKVSSNMNYWTYKLLSYGGRMSLIQLVIKGMLAFWAQVFILLKKLIKQIETKCGSILWSRKLNLRKANVLWELVCKRKAGGS